MLASQHKIKDEKGVIEYCKQLFSSGEINKALAMGEQTITHNPSFIKLWILLTQFYQQNSEFDKMLNQALALSLQHPDNPIVLFRKIECLIYAGEIQRAIASLDQFYKIAGNNDRFYSKLAELYLHCSQHQQVALCHEKALHIAPKNSHYRYNLASAKLTLGKIDEASKLLEQVIQQTPSDFDAYYSRSTLSKKSSVNNNIEQLKQVLKKNSGDHQAVVATGYALSKEYEDIGEYQQAFEYLELAANQRKRNMQYQVSNDRQAMDKIKSSFNKKNLLSIKSSSNQESPIFILGLPRSGTTLVERILSSHSKVASLGEVNNFAFSMIHTVGPHKGKMDLIEKSISIDFNQLATRYSHATRGYGIKAEFLIDKTPLNFLYLGLIKKAFPNAKIIHLIRHPLDSCFAMYKTLFRMGYPFSYNLQDIGEYYVAYHQLMVHWREVFNGDFFDLDYRLLVNQPQGQSKALIEYCQLDWQPSILDFHQNNAPSATASAVQVRQPIYKSSVNRWQHYEKQLESLKYQLTENGINCD